LNIAKIIFWEFFSNFKEVVGAQSFQTDFLNFFLLGVKISGEIEFVFQKWTKIKKIFFRHLRGYLAMTVSGNSLTIFFSEFFTEELENGIRSTFRFYVQLFENIVFEIFLGILRGLQMLKLLKLLKPKKSYFEF
jgi:hypothetical protein